MSVHTAKSIRFGFSLGLLISLIVMSSISRPRPALLLPSTSSESKNQSRSQDIENPGTTSISLYDTALNPDRMARPTNLPSVLAARVIKPDFQMPPDPNQPAPVYSRIPTNQPVVFLTIDDGEHKNVEGLRFLQYHGMVASLFLNNSAINDNYDYFRQLQRMGSVIENHTLNHAILPKLSYEEQKREICANADIFAKTYGRRPTLFRPPGGFYDISTRQAAHDCGMKALVMWHAKVNNKAVQYQEGDRLLPGDIVLMHFRAEMLQDLQAFDRALKDANLQVALLEDWLK